MISVTFPKPKPFGQAMTRRATLKVIEEAAELVEAVKLVEETRASLARHEWAHRADASAPPYEGEPPAAALAWALDEAMDTWQALSNAILPYVLPEAVEVTRPSVTKGRALDVLEQAAFLHVDNESGSTRFIQGDASKVQLALANLLAGTFSDGEIRRAYERCVERNRARGRYE